MGNVLRFLLAATEGDIELEQVVNGAPEGDIEQVVVNGAPEGDIEQVVNGALEGDIEQVVNGAPEGDIEQVVNGAPEGDIEQVVNGAPESYIELEQIANDDTVPLLPNDDEEVQIPTDQHRGSIFMVPSVYRDLSPRSYTPRVVSIGPLHHQNEKFVEFEAQKTTEKNSLFYDVLLLGHLESPPEDILGECEMRVRHTIDHIKAFYIGMQEYSTEELVQMMVTDACFILAILYKIKKGKSLGPICFLCTHIVLDMVLIENQIPFFVLKAVHRCIFRNVARDNKVSVYELVFLIQKFINLYDAELVLDRAAIIGINHRHILDILHKSYRDPLRRQETLILPISKRVIKGHTAVELERSGVRFSKRVRPDEMFPMAMEVESSKFRCFPLSWFSKHTLKMPVLHLGDDTELIVRNLIMYEQYSRAQTCFTSYMHALNKLIDTPEDVATLVKSQVLLNELGSDEDAANLINNVLKDFPHMSFYYQDQWDKLDKYCDAKWPRFIAELRRTYFNNPWSIIALIAGIILFVLQVVQTLYSVKGSKAA